MRTTHRGNQIIDYDIIIGVHAKNDSGIRTDKHKMTMTDLQDWQFGVVDARAHLLKVYISSSIIRNSRKKSERERESEEKKDIFKINF